VFCGSHIMVFGSRVFLYLGSGVFVGMLVEVVNVFCFLLRVGVDCLEADCEP
jgi:hypothetical protein